MDTESGEEASTEGFMTSESECGLKCTVQDGSDGVGGVQTGGDCCVRSITSHSPEFCTSFK